MRQWMEWIRERRQFATDRNGGVMMIFALSLVPIIMVLGLSLDGLRAIKAGTLTTNALDTAALAAARGMKEDNLSDSKVVEMAQIYFNANVSATRGVSFSPVDVTFNRETGQVDVAATASIETTFGRIFHVEQLDITRKSQAIYKLNEIELGLMLDVTGSMRGQKLADLQAAAKLAIDILLPDSKTGAPTRIGLAPYAATVNAGVFAHEATDGASVDGCVFEREGADAYKDAAPGPGNFFSYEPNPKRGKAQNGHYSCPNAAIEPLTDNKLRLEDAIDDLSAKGWTAGHLGVAWAWYLVSPSWGTVWPSGSRPNAYGTQDLIKAVFLMTDGEFNTSYLNGAPNKTSDTQAVALCDEMKSKDVVVFAIGFELDEPAAINVLRNCATSEKHFKLAENGTELKQAFVDFAMKLNSLRISQ